MRLLKKDGLIKDAPGRGVLVAPLGENSLAHIYQIRGSIDSLAARLAAQRRAVLDPALIERGRKSSRNGDVRAMIDADIANYAICRRARLSRSAASAHAIGTGFLDRVFRGQPPARLQQIGVFVVEDLH